LAQSGHSQTEFQCPLLGVKRTLVGRDQPPEKDLQNLKNILRGLTRNPCSTPFWGPPGGLDSSCLQAHAIADVLTMLRVRQCLQLSRKGVLYRQCISRTGLEQTKVGLRFKAPKTKHGLRSMTLAASVISELRAHCGRKTSSASHSALVEAHQLILCFRPGTVGLLCPTRSAVNGRALLLLLAAGK